MKYVKGSIMSDQIANQDIENTAKKVKSSEKVIEVVEKLLEVIKAVFYGFSMNKVKYLKDLN